MAGLQDRTLRTAMVAAAIALTLLLLAPPPANADVFAMAGGADARVNVVSMKARKFESVIPQQYDFSCGSAALATLLTFHYDRATSETDAFRAMWEVGDQERIRQLGFSLFEMKSYLESTGLKADGFKLTLGRVQEIGVPGIALINVKGYRHFVVIKGITDKKVVYGDPSRGVISQKREEFEKIWDGVILFIRSDVARGKNNFNKREDWKLAPIGPNDRALDRETLQNITLTQTRSLFSGFSIGVPEQ